MIPCLFTSDLHGKKEHYHKLFSAIRQAPPAAVFLGGDLFPAGGPLGLVLDPVHPDFLADFLLPGLTKLRDALGAAYPRLLVILGNDDGRREEPAVRLVEDQGIWEYVHDRRVELAGHPVFGYSFVPPTPFLLKDWERYDVSRFVDPGAVSPEEGLRSVPVPEDQARYATIQEDLGRLAGKQDLAPAVFLFHAPPYQTKLDRAALDGQSVEAAPLDLHVGSVAIRRFIETRQPLLTLHGHVHESARLTGDWRDRLGRTHCFSAAHDGPELAVVRFDLEDLSGARRELV
jgi:Icc-related predicted phosphoesterase